MILYATVILTAALLYISVFIAFEVVLASRTVFNVKHDPQKTALATKIVAVFRKNPLRSELFFSIAVGLFTVAASLAGMRILFYYFFLIENSFTSIITISVLILAITAAIMTLSELLKTVCQLNPRKSLLLLSGPVIIVWALLFPIIVLSEYLLRVMRVKKGDNSIPGVLLSEGNSEQKGAQGVLSEHGRSESARVDIKMFKNALMFGNVRVRDCMIPRTEISAVEVHTEIPELKETLIKSGHSKIFVYDGTNENIIGYCHAVELFKKPKTIQEILSPTVTVPEAMPAKTLMVKFTEEGKSIALVTDEFGALSGVVSIEDLIEEIFGEIEDEFDTDSLTDKDLGNSTRLLSARFEIDYLNEKYGQKIPVGDYETLGGYILSVNENIPKVGDVIETKTALFTIVSVQDARIDTVKIKIKSGNTD